MHTAKKVKIAAPFDIRGLKVFSFREFPLFLSILFFLSLFTHKIEIKVKM